MMDPKWFTAGELAAERLPGFPKTKAAVLRLAESKNWNGYVLHARKRGGTEEFEYTVRLLPDDALLVMIDKYSKLCVTPPDPITSSWLWFNSRSELSRNEAVRRLAVITFYKSVQHWFGAEGARFTAERFKISVSTVYEWAWMIGGMPEEHWLPALAPARDRRVVISLGPAEAENLKSYSRNYEKMKRLTDGQKTALGFLAAVTIVWAPVIWRALAW